MNTLRRPRLLLALSSLAAFASTAQAQYFTQDFESFIPPSLGAGWYADTGGNITAVTGVSTNDVSLVIAGAQSALYTISGAAGTFDDNLGGYYAQVGGGVSLAPGTYTISVAFRVLDPGVTANVQYYYESYNSDYSIQTNNIELTSPGYTSVAGTMVYTSPAFTINPNNPEFYSGLALQATVGGVAVTDARIVIDSAVISAIPESASASLLAGATALGMIALRRKRPVSS